MVLAVSGTLFLGVIIWAGLSAGEIETLLTAATALGAATAAGLAWRHRVTTAAIVLTLAMACVPLVGFGSVESSTSTITELLWIAIAFSAGGVIIPGKLAILTLVGLWAISSTLLFMNDGIPKSAATQATVLLAVVCAVSSVISYLGNRLEAHLDTNHQRIGQVYGLMESQNVKLDAALLREQSLSRLKEEFLASMSHELRTPLNAILGLCEALQEDVYGSLTEMQRRSLETIEGSGRRLLGRIVDILDLARIGAGKLPTNIQPTDADQLVTIAARGMQDLIDEKKLEIKLTLLERATMLHTDATKCKRILRCLLSNAIKFTEEGGEIGVEVGHDTELGLIRFVVWDTGIGIAENQLQQLARPFEQSDSGLSRMHEGLGLGLTLSTKLSHLIGATIQVESTIGEGSRFSLVVRQDGPTRITLYGDLNCPFSYTLNEWFEQAALAHLVAWRGIEHMADLTHESARNATEQAKLTEELVRLGSRAAETLVEIKRPACRPNSRVGLVALKRVEARYPERSADARNLLFRAVWRKGRDISDPDVVRDVLSDLDLGDLTKNDDEVREIATQTSAWRGTGHATIPMAVSHGSKRVYEGLGHRGLLLAYVEEEFGISDAGLDISCISDLAKWSAGANVPLRPTLNVLHDPNEPGDTTG